MDLLSDIITYFRRIVKAASPEVVTDGQILDYINRFWINDVDPSLQTFDLKTKYQFLTTPGVDKYNMPLYNVQGFFEFPDYASYPMYQGFLSPLYVNGVQCAFYTEKHLFYAAFPDIVQTVTPIILSNSANIDFKMKIPGFPLNSSTEPPVNAILRGHVDIAGIAAMGEVFINDPPLVNNMNLNIKSTSVDAGVFISFTGSNNENQVYCDTGQFLSVDQNYGLLAINFNNGPNALQPTGSFSTVRNTINYLNGELNLRLLNAIPDENQFKIQYKYFQTGMPRAVLFYNNTLVFRSVPDTRYLVEVDAYLSPSAFFRSTDTFSYGYMSEYIARGAARKYLSDTGDVEQLNFYEPFFKEQELMVWKRSQRQWTATRTQTLYSQGKLMGIPWNIGNQY